MRRSWLVFGVALTSAGSAVASPVDSFGLGSRATALGGAVSARVSDFSANYYNPSGLALARGTELQVGYMSAAHALELNGNDARIDPVRGLVGGLVAPGRVAGLPFAFGIATHLSDDRISRARTVRQELPRFILYDNRSQLLYLAANLAIAPFDWLSIGGGITFLASTRGAFYVRGTAKLPNNQRSEYDSELDHAVDADLTSVRYAQFGATAKPSEAWALSLVHRQSAQIALEIGAELRGTVDATVLKVPAYYALDSRTANAYLPARWVLGAAYRPTPRWSLGVDLEYVRWSGYTSPVSRSTTVLDVTVPGNLVEIPPSPKPSRVDPPDFRDVFVPRLGAEYALRISRAVDLPLRAGYVFERSPVPPQRGVTNFVDGDRHLFSLGVGAIWHEPGALVPGDLRLDLHAQLSYLPTTITLKDSAADYIGDYGAGGTITNLGATLGVGFR